VPAPGGWNMDSHGHLTPARATAGQVVSYPYPIDDQTSLRLMKEPEPAGR
jgi:hypothetical protein